MALRRRKPLLYPLSYGGAMPLSVERVARGAHVGAGREVAAGAEVNGGYYALAFACRETQRPNVVYLELNAATLAFFSVAHVFAEATVACCCACVFADAFVETHLPNASSFEP